MTTAHPASRDLSSDKPAIVRRPVIEFMHEERLSRQQAAERLADIAYALSVGGTLELRAKGKLVKVPVSDEVFLRRESRTGPDHAAVEVDLTWFV